MLQGLDLSRASQPVAGVFDFVRVHGDAFSDTVWIYSNRGVVIRRGWRDEQCSLEWVIVRQDAGGGIFSVDILPQNATVLTNVYWVQKSRKNGYFW